jgi:hypothetical protein
MIHLIQSRSDSIGRLLIDLINFPAHFPLDLRDGGLELHEQNIITPCRNATLSKDKHAVEC